VQPRQTRHVVPSARPIVYRGGVAAVFAAGVVHYQMELSPAERRVVRAMALGLERMPDAEYADLMMFAAFFLLGGASFAGERERSDADLAATYQVPPDLVRLRRQLPEPRRPF
jgi:hypothetical protein